jgi:flagellar basal-body rod protein FlgB
MVGYSVFQGIAVSLERYMNLLSVRQKLVSSNIANADTPGYHTQDIDFRAEFERESSSLEARVIQPPNLPVKGDGNNVNLDREARMLSENALRFAVASNLARAELHAVKAAMEEGKSS